MGAPITMKKARREFRRWAGPARFREWARAFYQQVTYQDTPLVGKLHQIVRGRR